MSSAFYSLKAALPNGSDFDFKVRKTRRKLLEEIICHELIFDSFGWHHLGYVDLGG
jgi:hypothetical protein